MTLYRNLVSGKLYKAGKTTHQAMLIINEQWKNSFLHTNTDLLNKNTFEVIAK